jgi:hypothetical protein
MLFYLAAAWPYMLWQLQLLEWVAHGLETAIFIMAMTQMDGESHTQLAWAMIGEAWISCEAHSIVIQTNLYWTT